MTVYAVPCLSWLTAYIGSSPRRSQTSPANGTILNPYYGTLGSITPYSRSNIQVAKSWSPVVVSNAPVMR